MRVESQFLRVTLAAACILGAALYVRFAFRAFRASYLAAKANQGDLQKAIQAEPSNAEYHDRLGQLLAYDGQDPEIAVSQFQAAVGLNPYVSRYWLDLANAYLVTGRSSEQRDTLERAVRADPTTPDVAWQVANFLLLQGDHQNALRRFRVVLANDPTRVDQALRLCWRVTPDVNEILDEAIPDKPEVYFSLLHLVIQRKETAPAEIVWNRLIALKQPFAIQLAFPYIHFLLAARQVAAAESAWRDLASLDPSLTPYLHSPANLVVNGGFEEKILDGGFDWRYSPSASVTLAIDTNQLYSGTRSLVISFDGQNPPNAGIAQFVPAKPDTDYEFTGAYRTEDIMSASGPRFSITDADSNESYVLTDDFLGSSPWRLLSVDFHTGRNTELLLLTISRQPAGRLIRGKMWIDDLKLIEKK
jgi:tetratricopeptide (TPR) repeat protein